MSRRVITLLRRAALIAALSPSLATRLAADELQGVGYSQRPPVNAPFVAEFVKETGGQDPPFVEARFRVFQDREGRQRIDSWYANQPELWFGSVSDWVAGIAFMTAGGPRVEPSISEIVELSSEPDGEWAMGLPAGEWRITSETEGSHAGLLCRRIVWERPDGGRLTVWVAKELGYPIRQEFVLPGLSKTVRMTRLSREEPPPSLFRRPE